MSNLAPGKQGGESAEIQGIELLSKPVVRIQEGTALKVIAVSSEENQIPLGYIATRSGRARIIGEFSGEPTGEVMPCNSVTGWVGDNEVYRKIVSTDMPLSGIRTAIAQRRASNRVKKRLK